MTRDDADEQLGFLIRDSVADVEPDERLGELRARTAGTTSSRRWWPAAGGAVLAAAAAVTAIAVLGNEPAPTVEPGPADPPPASEEAGRAVAAYFVGPTPEGPRLYREFQQVVDPSPGLAGLALLESGPDDPDYASLWPAGSFRLDRISDPEGGIVHVFLTEAAPEDPSYLALQQVVYTVSAGFQEPLEVNFHRGGSAVVERISAAPQLDVLARVNLSDPSEGQVVEDTLVVEGRANSFEANVRWSIERDGVVVAENFFTALGYTEPRLFPFSGEIDVSSLDPGAYTLIVETDDPSGGAEGGPGVFTDTRTFVID